jgi:integrase
MRAAIRCCGQATEVSRRRADFGAIRRLRSGRWQARYHDRAGRRHAQSFSTRGDASRWLAAARADLDRGEWFDPNTGRKTIGQYATEWLPRRRVKGRPLASRTLDRYAGILRTHIVPTLGETQLRHLDPAAVRRWHASLTAPGGPGPATVAKAYRLLHAICATAVAEELIARNPCTIPGASAEPSSERPTVSVPEVYALADAVLPRWRALVLLATFGGLRFGELAGLTRDRLDLLHGTVSVVEDLDELDGGQLAAGRVKSDASRRTVAVPPHLLDDLTEHLSTYAAPDSRGFVFVGPRGGPLRRSNFREDIWLPAVTKIGRPELHFHDLRGCSATLAAVSGATIAELMRRLGHATPSVAMRYQRATADRDAALAKLMSERVTSADVTPLRRTGEGRAPDH